MSLAGGLSRTPGLSRSSSGDECECCDHDHGHEHSHNGYSNIARQGDTQSHDHGHRHGHDHTVSQSHDHGHEHEHHHTGSYSHDHGHGHHAGHHHSMGHDHGGGHDCGCCGDDSSSQQSDSCDCCGDNHAPTRTGPNCGDDEDDCCNSGGCDHSHTHSHTHAHTYANNAHSLVDLEACSDNAPLLPTSPSPLPTSPSLLCNLCDPASLVLHIVQVTRFRVANLCCAGEETLIRDALRGMVGVEHVAINIVGRYAVIKHCNVHCCAPSEKILDTLNALHLGVSIHEVGEDDEDTQRERVDVNELLLVLVVLCLFLTGLVLYVYSPTHSVSQWVFVPCIAIGLLPIVYNACISLAVRRVIDINTLIVLAIAGAIAVDEFFDAALVVTMFLAAECIESAVMVFVRNAISLSTSSSMPQRAFTVDGRSLRIEDISIGDVLAVRAGEMLVCDGVVVKGEGVVDESSLTGEPVPVLKKRGSAVLSGTVVQNGYIEVEITKSVQDSTMKQLKQAVEDVQADRGEYAALVDRFARYWTPLIITATVLLIVIGGAVSDDWRGYLHRGLVLLILACPCAIVVAAPIPSVCAIATAAKGGVLIKGSSVIERLCTVDTVAADKTGTLTKGYFQVRNKLILPLVEESSSVPLHNTHQDHHIQSPHDALTQPTQKPSALSTHTDCDPYKLAVALEAKSTHPLANAIVSDYCGCIAEMLAEDLALPAVKRVRVREGVGLEGYVLTPTHTEGEKEKDKESGVWRHVVVGNERLLSSHGGHIHTNAQQNSQIEAFISQNASCVVLLVVVDDAPRMLLSLADELRVEARDFVLALREREIRVSMLTGDHASVAQRVADELSIDDVHARLLPAQKLQWIRDAQDKDKAKQCRLKRGARRVLMIGDGINDSTALACATVGVAMGAGGTAMAVAAADVVLLNDNLSLLPSTFSLCRLARNAIVQNCVFAIAVKVVAMVLAVAGMLDFWEAVLIDIGSLLVVVLNGTKVLSFRGFNAPSGGGERVKSGEERERKRSDAEVEMVVERMPLQEV